VGNRAAGDRLIGGRIAAGFIRRDIEKPNPALKKAAVDLGRTLMPS
jgi:hypothetical protein